MGGGNSLKYASTAQAEPQTTLLSKISSGSNVARSYLTRVDLMSENSFSTSPPVTTTSVATPTEKKQESEKRSFTSFFKKSSEKQTAVKIDMPEKERVLFACCKKPPPKEKERTSIYSRVAQPKSTPKSTPGKNLPVHEKIWSVLVMYKKVAIFFTVIISLGIGIAITDALFSAVCSGIQSIPLYPLGVGVSETGYTYNMIEYGGFLRRCKNQRGYIIPWNLRMVHSVNCLTKKNEYKYAAAKATGSSSSASSKNNIAGGLSASGSFWGVTANSEVSFEKSDSMEKSISNQRNENSQMAVQLETYNCKIGFATIHTLEFTQEFKDDMALVKRNHSTIPAFFERWGIGMVSSVDMGGGFFKFYGFSSCDQSAAKSLNDIMDKCVGSNFKASASSAGGAFGGGANFGKSSCDASAMGSNHEESFKKTNKVFEQRQIGGAEMSGKKEWQKTLQENPVPLGIRVTPLWSLLASHLPKDLVEKMKSFSQGKMYNGTYIAESVPKLYSQCG